MARRAADLLRHNGQIAYAGLIEPFVQDESVTGVIQITLLDHAARALLQSFGISA